MTPPPVVNSAAPPLRRGRPRSTEARAAVLRAARAILDESGPTGVTIERVAERAGVGKPTIYRTWPNAQAVLMAALMDAPAGPARRRPQASAVAALRRQLREIVRVFAAPTGRSVTLMLAAAEADTELSKAFRHHFILARRDEGRQLVAAAIARREVRADLDVDALVDVLYGPIFFRVLLGHAPLDDGFAERILDHVLRGIARPRRTRASA